MSEKTLIFIPYQDSDNFLSDGILTREFSMLYSFWVAGYRKVINVKKPRTILDKKRYSVREEYYPKGTVEYVVKDILDEASTIQYQPIIDFKQITQRRGWWNKGYRKTISLLKTIEDDVLVYSDNPFAVDLLRELSAKKCKIYFDIMDNFAIHPSLNENEREIALNGYREVFEFADCISANSEQTCNYMKSYTEREIVLVKNGVFLKNEIENNTQITQLEKIRKEKKKYKKCVGYIGKLGLRLDAKLIEEVSARCPDTLFVFVGGYLKGQINDRLLKLFNADNNVMHIDSIPSAYVYSICSEFDILSIPHSKGKAENGGDPLKLYQYLTRKKPVITTSILGVDEFQKYIKIADSVEEWVNFIQLEKYTLEEMEDFTFDWESRLKPIMEVVKQWNK